MMIELTSFVRHFLDQTESTFPPANFLPAQFSSLPIDNIQTKYHNPSSDVLVAQRPPLWFQNPEKDQSRDRQDLMMPGRSLSEVPLVFALDEVLFHAYHRTCLVFRSHRDA